MLQLYNEEQARVAGAERVKKIMTVVGIITGFSHLDNPFDIIKTNPVLAHLLRQFTDIEAECVESLLKDDAADETFGIESVLKKYMIGKCTKWMTFCLAVPSLTFSLISFRPLLNQNSRFS